MSVVVDENAINRLNPQPVPVAVSELQRGLQQSLAEGSALRTALTDDRDRHERLLARYARLLDDATDAAAAERRAAATQLENAQRAAATQLENAQRAAAAERQAVQDAADAQLRAAISQLTNAQQAAIADRQAAATQLENAQRAAAADRAAAETRHNRLIRLLTDNMEEYRNQLNAMMGVHRQSANQAAAFIRRQQSLADVIALAGAARAEPDAEPDAEP